MLKKFVCGFISQLSLLISLSTYSLSWNVVEEIVQKEKPSSVEEFLNSHRISPSTRTRFMALRYSGSIQAATEKCPRILVHNQDSSLIFSFNCGVSSKTSKKSGHSIEFARKNPKTQQYENISLFLSSTNSFFSETNPAECLACHKGDTTPSIINDEQLMKPKEIVNFLQELEKSTNIQAKLRYYNLNWSSQSPPLEIRKQIQKTWPLKQEKPLSSPLTKTESF